MPTKNILVFRKLSAFDLKSSVKNELNLKALIVKAPATVSLTEFNIGEREILSNLEISLEQFK